VIDVRLINPSYGQRGEHMAHHKSHSYRHKNPFGAGSLNVLAIKVAGGLAGGIGAATIPNAIAPSMASGWPGVAAALVIAFGGSWLLSKMSANFAEGVLIGGTLQAAGRISTIVLKKNLVSFSLSGYGPMQFPVPTPAYNVSQRTPQIPSSASAARPMTTSGMGTTGSKFGPKMSKWAA
jgi:hypothetical protein